MRNRFPGTCRCGKAIATGEGEVTKIGTVWVIHCAGMALHAAMKPAAAPEALPPITVCGIIPVVTLLETARQHLKFPAMIFAAGGAEYRLTIAGERAKRPGTINVTSVGGDGEDREWFGRIDQNGVYEPSQRVDRGTATAVAQALLVLARDPAGVAAAYGKRTGRCCFCKIALSDERSTAVGYGAICADHWGLPYPTKTEARAANAADVASAAA